MTAEDPLGFPLVETCTFEFKRGYNALSVLDCIASQQKRPWLVRFLDEVERDAADAGNWPVLVFHKRYKKPIICIRASMYNILSEWYRLSDAESLSVYSPSLPGKRYVLMRLQDFFDLVQPQFFLETANKTRFIGLDGDDNQISSPELPVS